MQEVLHYKHHLEGIILHEILGNPELHVARTFPPSDSPLRPRADIARKIHEPPVGKPQIVVHAECKLRLVFAKLGNIEMIYIIMTVVDTRREVRIPDSKRRRHTDIGSTIVRNEAPKPSSAKAHSDGSPHRKACTRSCTYQVHSCSKP